MTEMKKSYKISHEYINLIYIYTIMNNNEIWNTSNYSKYILYIN